MKKFYTRLLLIAVGMLVSFASEAAQITLNIDNLDAITVSSYSLSFDLTNETVIEYDANNYPTVYIRANSGYKAKVVDQNGNTYTANYGTVTLYLSEYTDGNVYTITTYNLEDMRTATAHVTVVGDPSPISASRAGGESFDLVEGNNEIKFIPGEESPFTFRNNNYSSFYRIEVNNEPLTMDGYSINVDVEDGTNIEIEASYPDIPVELTIIVPEDVLQIVQRVTANYEAIDNWKLNEPFEVNAGDQMMVQLDIENYALDGIYIDDKQQESTSYFYFTVGTEPTEMRIEAHNYGVLNYTLNVDDPTRIAVYEGTSTYGTSPLELEAGDNELTIGEKVGRILIKATTGNDIVSVTDAEDNPLTLSYGALTLQDGMYVKITSQERVYDGAFVVFVNNISEVGTGYGIDYNAYWSAESDSQTKNLLEEGYNIVKFATASGESHMVQVSTKTEPYVAYFNGELQENKYTSLYYTWRDVPNHGDVIKVFTDGAPEEYKVHITTTGDAAAIAGVALTVDVMTPVEDIEAADLTVLAGTLFTVTPQDDVTVGVSVDDTPLTADEDGTFSFTATAAHNVSISAYSAYSGIVNVSGDLAPAFGPVYNLQGIKVLDNSSNLSQLPAGIYIVNGKKRVVR